MKNTIATLQQQKQSGDKITMLTAYDYSIAALLDRCGVNAILVGDSLGMVMLGYENTLPVTMEDMLHHTKAVSRGAKHALVVADMPFMSYQVSVEQAVINAGRLIQEGGAQAVKLEGGAAVCDRITAIKQATIPVIGHLGLTPQSINVFGGFKVQAKTAEQAKRLVEDALRIQEAGADALVLECIPAPVGTLISELLEIPVIGIGAGNGCDGQVLVYSFLTSFQNLRNNLQMQAPSFEKALHNILQKPNLVHFLQRSIHFPSHRKNWSSCVLPIIRRQTNENLNHNCTSTGASTGMAKSRRNHWTGSHYGIPA